MRNRWVQSFLVVFWLMLLVGIAPSQAPTHPKVNAADASRTLAASPVAKP